MTLSLGCIGDDITDSSSDGFGPGVGEQGPSGDSINAPGPNEQYDDIGDARHPEVLVANEPTARSMRMVGDRLYWVEDGGPVYFLSWVRPHGGPVYVNAKMEDYPYALAIDERYAYWTVPEKGRLFRVSLEGGENEILWDDSDNAPTGVSLADDRVYFATGDGCVRSISFDGEVYDEIACGEGTPTHLAVHKDEVWWSVAEGGVLTADRYGSEAIKWASDQNIDSELVVDDEQVYWLDAHSRSVKVVNKEQQGLVRTLVPFQYAPVGITQDRFYIYFTTQSDNSVKVAYKGGAPSHVLADSQAYPGDITIHGDRLYWVNEGSGAIMTMDVR